MVLQVVKSGNDKLLYIVKKYRKNGKSTSTTIMKCGKLSELEKQYDDPIAYFTNKAKEMTEEENKLGNTSFVSFMKRKQIDGGKEILLNGGYLFLRKIYSSLHLDYFVKRIAKEYKLQYDLNKILQDLIYTRIIFPGSKLSSFEDKNKLIEKGDYELHDVYRALGVLNEWLDKIQAFVYSQSTKLVKRNTNILYFDCTNFFFEIEKEDEFRKYGASKEHRPNPIVQMGLFMDGNGIPLAFDLNPGNTNEQITLRPFEEQVIKDFNISKLVVCTDAGLASYSNRDFNDRENRAFIVTQSIKKLESYLKDWALDTDNFPKSIKDNEEKIFYKSRYIKKEMKLDTDTPLGKVKMGKEWRLIVTYSSKYAKYQKTLRDNQIKRAKALIDNPSKFNKVNSQDCKRFIKNIAYDSNGEIVSNKVLLFDESVANEEAKYDGFYAISTNLEGDEREIVKINHQRWEIEESFRIMKTDLRSRPVYVSLEEHISAHFLTCFLALLFIRIIEKKMDGKYTTNAIIEAIRNVNYVDVEAGYISAFSGNDLITTLSKEFKIECNYNTFTPEQMRKILHQSKIEEFATII